MTIAELLALLISAQKLTGQSSYERRAPAPKAVPALLAAKSEITRFLAENSESAEAYRLLSLAQECLLNFRGARTSLERAMSLSAQRNPKDLKHLALLREYESKWEALPLTPDELQNLGTYLSAQLATHGCDHTPRLTKEWLAQFSPGKHEQKLKALRNWGGYCDCEVLANAA
eukprot:gene39476-48780_t